MKKLLKAAPASLLLLCAIFTVTAEADDGGENPLQAVNAQVEQHAAKMDENFGVLLTGQERQNLKLKLIVTKMNKDRGDLSVAARAEKAVELFEIEDPVEQRQLLIEMQLEDDGDGLEPPK